MKKTWIWMVLLMLLLQGCQQEKIIYYRFPYMESLEGYVYDTISKENAIYKLNRAMIYYEQVSELILNEVPGGLIELQSSSNCIVIHPVLLEMIQLLGQEHALMFESSTCVKLVAPVDLIPYIPYFSYIEMIDVATAEGLEKVLFSSPKMAYSMGREATITFKAFNQSQTFTLHDKELAIRIDKKDYTIMYVVNDIIAAAHFAQAIQDSEDVEMILNTMPCLVRYYKISHTQ